jgi:hypothetical protein
LDAGFTVDELLSLLNEKPTICLPRLQSRVPRRGTQAVSRLQSVLAIALKRAGSQEAPSVGCGVRLNGGEPMVFEASTFPGFPQLVSKRRPICISGERRLQRDTASAA